MVVNKLTLEEKIGQMIMIGIGSKKDIPNVLNMIKNLHIGGVLLYKNNYDNYDEMIELIKKLHEANKDNKVPLLIAIDQEGGRVNRMPNDFLNLYSVTKQALTNEKIVKDSAKVTGKMLSNIGINLNFAPVADLNNDNNKALKNRCFSENPEQVLKHVKTYIKEFKNNKIVPVVKHFPGHGSTKTDSHLFLPVIKKYSDLKNDIKPFKNIMEEDCDAIMISHILIKDVDKIRPCTMSKKFIEKKIRKQLNYDNILITDEMRMRGIRYLYGKNNSILKAFKAGNDIILFKYRKNDEKLVEKIKKNIKDEKILNKHIERILNLKNKYKIEKLPNQNKDFINEINNEIKRINNIIEEKLNINK